jgi:intracellular sulfur oxidation DsrE/DsrF family protein
MSIGRRKLLGALAASGGLFALSATGRADSPAPAASTGSTTRFPGDPPENYVVYQLNRADPEYQNHILFSVGAMLRQYGDNIKIVVTAFGPGVHVLLKVPRRPVTREIREKIESLSHYGVEFHACGNTLTALGLTAKDVVPHASVVEVGAADLMELQKKGYAYISW